MSLTNKEMADLMKIIARANELISRATGEVVSTAKSSARGSIAYGRRRTGKELEAFRKMLNAERKAGIPVVQLAKKHGISPAYIYQIG